MGPSARLGGLSRHQRSIVSRTTVFATQTSTQQQFAHPRGPRCSQDETHILCIWVCSPIRRSEHPGMTDTCLSKRLPLLRSSVKMDTTRTRLANGILLRHQMQPRSGLLTAGLPVAVLTTTTDSSEELPTNGIPSHGKTRAR